MRKIISLLLCVLVCFHSVYAMAGHEYYGNLDGNNRVDAADALAVLKHAVGKTALAQELMNAADVDGDQKIDAVDALYILQYAVGLIERFPADGMTKQERYYSERDGYYGVDGTHFLQSDLSDLALDDAAQLCQKLGESAEPSDIVSYQINQEMNLDYTRISMEAAQRGELNRYDAAPKTEGTVTLRDGTVLTYQVPTNVTAYSAVPFTYTLVGGESTSQMHVEVTTWEDPKRAKNLQSAYYENTLPDQVNVEYRYEGYIQAERIEGVTPNWAARPSSDQQGTVYPNFRKTSLVRSGNLPAGKETWLKFTAVNTGNTILKGDGMGYFTTVPALYKKENGTYQKISEIDNKDVRMLEYWYPGETIEFYTRFSGANNSLAPGEYQVVLSGDLANEQDGPDWAAMYNSGRQVVKAIFPFTVSEKGEVTRPQPIDHQKKSRVTRNSWLGTYEEFQTSFHTHLNVSTDAKHPEEITFYFQPAPWDKTLTLRVISELTGEMKLVTLPLQVESDSITISLNPYNTNYVVNPDGTRTPILATQNMADMRGDVQDSPYAKETVINDLKNMKEAGINFLTSTMAFSYTLGEGRHSHNGFRFMMDAADLMGFSFESYGAYPYNEVEKNQALVRSYAGHGAANGGRNIIAGYLSNWIYQRFGRMMWSSPQGITPVAQEDSRGWLTIDHDWRMDLDDATVSGLQNWLKEAYGTINALNRAYGSSYRSFQEIDPRTEGVLNNNYYNFTPLSQKSAVYHERSDAIRQLDVYRTYKRVQDYREALSVMKIPGAKMFARYESSPLITVGLDPKTTNAHYRETYYQMQRAGLVGEVLAASDVVFGTSTYQNTPYTATETYELTKNATLHGLTVMNYHMHYREQIYNELYGDGKAVANLHLKNPDMKVTSIKTASALFPALKATYEAGGIPAVMWMDYLCNGFISVTSYKEIQFYTQKIQEMLATEEGKAWATEFEVEGSRVNATADHIFSYDPAYVQKLLAETPRYNKFQQKNTVNTGYREP